MEPSGESAPNWLKLSDAVDVSLFEPSAWQAFAAGGGRAIMDPSRLKRGRWAARKHGTR